LAPGEHFEPAQIGYHEMSRARKILYTPDLVRDFRWVLVLLGALIGCSAGGCAAPKGLIFEPPAKELSWPPPPEEGRIHFVGSLRTDKDLKPSKSFMKGLSEKVFGQNPAHSMLTPYAICTDDQDRVFVCDSNAQVVHVFNLKTRAYEQWKPEAPAEPFAQPVGVTCDASGRLLVSDSAANTIHVFDQSGHVLGTIGDGDLDKPSGIVVDPRTDRIFVANTGTHQILVLAPDGTLIERVGKRGVELGEFNFPTNLALGHDGSLYVSDTLNFRVQVFDQDLQPVLQIGSKGDLPGYFSHPKGIAIDSQEHVYVIDSHFESVQIFDTEGKLLLTFGEEGHGDGQFWLPTGISIDHQDRIWIADSYNQRIQVYQYRLEEQQ